MKRISIIFTIFLALAAQAPAFASIRFTATAQSASVSPGDRATVIATLVAPKAVSGVPQVARNDAFDVLSVNTGQSQSRNIQMINGKVEQKVEYVYRYIYTIVPRVDGPFTFPALTVTIDGVDYNTQPVRFNGGGGGAAGGTGGAALAEQQRSPDITASLTMSKRSLFPGEQAVLTLKVAQKANAPIQTQRGYTGALEQIEKAFGKEFSLNRLFTNQVTQGQERVDGELYNTFTLKFAVFGLTAGEYSIPAIRFEYDEIQRTGSRRANPFFSDFFDMDFFGGSHHAVQRSVRTAPFTVTVKPLPPSPPAGFSGSVGRFSLSASAEPVTVPAGEALTLRVTLRGNTRASNVGDPVMPELKGADVFTPERQTAVDTGDAGLSTRKTYRYLIVPREEGELTIDPITYPFLDPETGVFRTAQTNPITITVTPGKGGPKEQTRYLTQEEILQVGHDIRYIKTPARVVHREERPYRAPHWYLLFPAPFLIFLFALVCKLQSKRGGEKQFKSIRQKALSNAVRELNKASKTCANDNDFLGMASNVIEKYISRKFAIPATGRTLEELKDELLSRKIDEKTVTGLTVLIESINEHRFGGKAFDTKGRSDIINRTVTFLSSMEKVVKKEKITTAALLTIAALTAFALPASASAPRENIDVWFGTANDFYAAGEYDSALANYAKIIDAGVRNGAVYFNMGNCYHRLKNPGMARLHYEKAAILSPNDPDIEANINFIKSIIVDRVADGQNESDFLAAVMYNIHTLLPLETQLVFLCALLFILALTASAMLFKKGLARLLLAYGAVLCAILIAVVGTSAGYKIYALENIQHAIVMTQSLDAKNQPEGTQTLFTVHEGTKLRVSKTVGGWSLVSLPNGASGWVTTGSLGRI